MATPRLQLQVSRRRAPWPSPFQESRRKYRAARDRLLQQEIELRRALEAVALARRRLPPGHVGTLEPLWNLYDLTPEGRGTDWEEQLAYRRR